MLKIWIEWHNWVNCSYSKWNFSLSKREKKTRSSDKRRTNNTCNWLYVYLITLFCKCRKIHVLQFECWVPSGRIWITDSFGFVCLCVWVLTYGHRIHFFFRMNPKSERFENNQFYWLKCNMNRKYVVFFLCHWIWGTKNSDVIN